MLRSRWTFYDLRRLGGLDVPRHKNAACNLAVERGDLCGGVRVAARHNLGTLLNRMLAVAGVDALRAVRDLEVTATDESGHAFKYGGHDFLRDPGVDGGLKDDGHALAQVASHALSRTSNTTQVRLLKRVTGVGTAMTTNAAGAIAAMSAVMSRFAHCTVRRNSWTLLSLLSTPTTGIWRANALASGKPT